MTKPSFPRLGLLAGPCILLLLGISTAAHTAKVTLDPENWGNPEGQACADCHKKSSPGLADQWQRSAHALQDVNCLDCHQADAADDDAMEHEGAVIATIVSPEDCGRCHTTEYKQSAGSVHTKARLLIEQDNAGNPPHPGPVLGAGGCDGCHGSRVEVKGDGTLAAGGWPNTGIGRVNPDGSLGSCSACHGRHQFSKSQARDPSACTWCHRGNESPDAETYASSKHGILFAADRAAMNMESDHWVAGSDYSVAPTCVSCHMGASPGLKPTHDVGMRDAWSLKGPVSEKQYLVVFKDGQRMNLPATQPAPRRGSELVREDGTSEKVQAVADPKRRRQAMQQVCLECHSESFAQGAFKQFDQTVERYNREFGRPSKAIMDALYQRSLLTPTPFDEPLEFTYWRLWHDAGNHVRHGAAMGSPSTTWQDGIQRLAQTFYEHFLPQVLALAGEEVGGELIQQHVTSVEAHGWLSGKRP